VAFTYESLERTDGDRLVNLSTATFLFAWSGADAPANRSKGIRLSGNVVRFAVTAFFNQGNVPSCFGVNRARHHTREVGVKPIEVYELDLVGHLVNDVLEFFSVPRNREPPLQSLQARRLRLQQSTRHLLIQLV
jgi:hypothetical protein